MYDYNPYPPPYTTKEDLPNTRVTLVLGIVTVVMLVTCCFSSIGFITGIIAIVFGATGRKQYLQNPDRYTESSYKNLNIGFICAIVGVVLNFIVTVFAIFFVLANSPEFRSLFH